MGDVGRGPLAQSRAEDETMGINEAPADTLPMGDAGPAGPCLHRRTGACRRRLARPTPSPFSPSVMLKARGNSHARRKWGSRRAASGRRCALRRHASPEQPGWGRLRRNLGAAWQAWISPRRAYARRCRCGRSAKSWRSASEAIAARRMEEIASSRRSRSSQRHQSALSPPQIGAPDSLSIFVVHHAESPPRCANKAQMGIAQGGFRPSLRTPTTCVAGAVGVGRIAQKSRALYFATVPINSPCARTCPCMAFSRASLLAPEARSRTESSA